MEINGRPHINNSLKPVFTGKRYWFDPRNRSIIGYADKNGGLIPCSIFGGGLPYAKRYSKKTVEEIFSLVNSCGKLNMPIDDLKMIFTGLHSQKVLNKNQIKNIELVKTERTIFFSEVSYLFEQINRGRWIDGTKKYSSFSILKEKPNGIVLQNKNDISALSIPQLMTEAHKLIDNGNELGIAIKYYERVLELDPPNKQVLAIMMSLAHHKYENDLENRLKIYEAILKHNSNDECTISVMMSLAHHQYDNDLENKVKIYGVILKYNPNNKLTMAVMMDIAHRKYENDLENQLKIYEAILKCNPNEENTIAVMMDIAHKIYENDLDNQLKIYESILKYNPNYENTIAVMMDIAHKKYDNDLENRLKICETILKYNPKNENIIAIMMDIAHRKYENDRENRSKIYEAILKYDPSNEVTIIVMMDIAVNKYRYNSPDYNSILNILEKYHPINDFNSSDRDGKRSILRILYLKKDYKKITQLTENTSTPEQLQWRSEALRKLGSYPEAIEIISSVDLAAVPPDLKTQLTTCKLYCLYEMNKWKAEKLLDLAETVEKELSSLASPPSRLAALLGYCYDSIGKIFGDNEYMQKAKKIFEKLLLESPDNAKGERYLLEQAFEE